MFWDSDQKNSLQLSALSRQNKVAAFKKALGNDLLQNNKKETCTPCFQTEVNPFG